jgi:hypothetical protein
MHLVSHFPRSLRLALRGACLLLAAASAARAAQAPAQPTLPSLPSLPQVDLTALVNERKDFVDAKSLAKAGTLVAAQAALTRGNTARTNTPEWHFETSGKLILLAHDLARDNSPQTVKDVANLTLQQLTQAADATTDSKVKAQAKAASGFVQERLLGDFPSAITAYRAAAQLSPTDTTIQETLGRLERTDAILQARLQAAKAAAAKR